MISAIDGYQEQAILDSFGIAQPIPDIRILPTDTYVPQNSNDRDRIINKMLFEWTRAFPQKVNRADVLLTKYEQNTLSDVEYAELDHMLGDPMMMAYAQKRIQDNDTEPYNK